MENRKDIKIYFGISAGNWKQRLYSHWHSFSNPSLGNQTALSKWFWRLKDSSHTSLVWWNFIKSNFRSRCNLCLEEKISIIKNRNTSKLLNQRKELIFKCCHKNRYKTMGNDFKVFIFLKRKKLNNFGFEYICFKIWSKLILIFKKNGFIYLNYFIVVLGIILY